MAKNNLDAKNDESLYIAVIKGDLKTAQDLIKKGADVNYVNSNNESSLIRAALNGDVQITQFLIDNGADLNFQDNKGKTPLHLAVENGHFSIVRLLLSKEADVDLVDFAGNRPINYAKNNIQITKALEAARKKAFKEELGEIFNESNLKNIAYDFHKDGSQIPREQIRETQRRMAQTKKEALTIKEAMLGKDVVTLQDIQKKDRGAHVGSRGGAGAGRSGGRG